MGLRVRSHALLFLLLPCTAAAQESRDDAIRMLLAGDYQRAAQALRPLAEDRLKPDPAAQFLLALLYESGQGVPRSGMRACGLFLQTAASDSAFAEQAAAIGRRLKEEMGPMADQLCAPGPWHELPASSFTLGPNHSVEFTGNTIVVRYQGAEQRIMTGNLPGVVPLPVHYTPLDVTNPVRERRHFIQSFFWVPDNPTAPSSWALYWGLSEIAGAEFLNASFERNVVVVAGAQPPTGTNVTGFARVQVSATGEAESVITSGPYPRGAILPRREPR